VVSDERLCGHEGQRAIARPQLFGKVEIIRATHRQKIAALAAKGRA
jgi:hypothetical protein